MKYTRRKINRMVPKYDLMPISIEILALTDQHGCAGVVLISAWLEGYRFDIIWCKIVFYEPIRPLKIFYLVIP